jgi:hypothetical protein
MGAPIFYFLFMMICHPWKNPFKRTSDKSPALADNVSSSSGAELELFIREGQN